MVATENRTVRLVELPLSELRFAPYQRVLRNKWKEIAKDFDPDVAWPIVVSDRDGQYWTVDGQHRVVAAIDVGLTHAQCKVSEWSYEEEARMFKKLNKIRGALLAKDAFHSDLSWGEPVAVEIEAIVRQEGYMLFLGYGSPSSTSIGAIGSIENIYKWNQPEGLRRVLATLQKTWGADTGAVKNDMLLGMAAFLRRYPDVSVTDLARKLQDNACSVLEVLQDAALMKRGGQGTMATCVARAILGQYNRGKSTRRLPNLFDAQRNSTD